MISLEIYACEWHPLNDLRLHYWRNDSKPRSILSGALKQVSAPRRSRRSLWQASIRVRHRELPPTPGTPWREKWLGALRLALFLTYVQSFEVSLTCKQKSKVASLWKVDRAQKGTVLVV